METLSNKAKIVLEGLKQLDAVSEDKKVNVYTLEDYIGNEDGLYDALKEQMEEQDFMDNIIELNVKSINAVINALAKKGYVNKTEPHSIKIDGETRNLREYYLIKLDF